MKACVVLSEGNLKRAMSIVEKFDMAEVRLDLCKFNPSQMREIFGFKKGLIATYRLSNPREIDYKMDMLKRALEYGASYVDIEYNMDDKLIYEMILFARNYGAKVIISYHDFNKTASDEELHKVVEDCVAKGADIVKIVTKANSKEDCLRLLNLYKLQSNLIAFGMGEDAKFTRMSSLFLGAPFTYVYYGGRGKTADGQFNHREFSHLVEGLSATA